MIFRNGTAAPLATVTTGRRGGGASCLKSAVHQLYVMRAAVVLVLRCSSVRPVHKHPALRVHSFNHGSFTEGGREPERRT